MGWCLLFDMSIPEEAPEIRPAARPDALIAAAVCFVFTLLFICAMWRVVESMDALWVRWLTYAAPPIAATFATLYRSHWHEERTGLRRVGSALAMSVAIFCGVVAVCAVGLAVAWYCAIGVPVGQGVR